MKKFYLITLLLLLFTGITSAINTAITYNLGIVAFRKGNYDEALEKFKLVYRENARDFEAVYNIGNCYYKKKQYYLAIKWYLRARRLRPFDNQNLFNLSLAYVKIRRYERAIKSLNALLTMRRDDSKVYYLLGSIHLYMGSFDKAIKNYRAGVQIHTGSRTIEREGYRMLFYLHSVKRQYVLAENYAKNIETYFNQDAFFNFNLGFVYKNLGNFSKAEKKYKKAIKINPNFKAAYINYIYILSLQNKWFEVEKTSKEAIKRFNREFYFYISAGLALYRQKKFKDSLKYLKDALAINKTSVGAMDFVAHLNLTLDKIPEAIKYYERVLVHQPSKISTLVNLAYLYAKANDLVKGVLTIHLGLQNGADPKIFRYLAQLYLKAGDINNAYQCYVNYLKKYPRGDYITFYNLAIMYETQNKDKLALRYYKKSIKMNYLFFNSHFNLALLYERMQKESKAISHYILCTNIYPNNFEPFYRIFSIYAQNGEYNIAIIYLDKAIKIGFRNIERIKNNTFYYKIKNFNKFKKLMKKHFPNVSL